MNETNFVIIGASAAGITAAKTIRKLRPEADVTILSSDSVPYSRVMMHKYLSGESDLAGICFIKESFFDDSHITWKKHTTVSAIDPQAKIVRTQDSTERPYDKLLLATGANYNIPPIPNLREANNVFGFRDLSDADRILTFLSENPSCTRCTVIGAGLVGLDVVEALLHRDVAVTVIEMDDRPAPLQLDQASGRLFQDAFEQHGAKFMLSSKVNAVNLNTSGAAESLLVNDSLVACDFIVVCAGVRPNSTLAEQAGLQTGRGITVNEFLQTSDQHIYAAGDATGLSGIWSSAMKQGEIAATNMCGLAKEYVDPFSAKNPLNFYNLSAWSIGEVNLSGEEYHTLIKQDNFNYQKIILKGNHAVGVILVGDTQKFMLWENVIKHKRDLSFYQGNLFDLTQKDLVTE